jgi:hypothetical protein
MNIMSTNMYTMLKMSISMLGGGGVTITGIQSLLGKERQKSF